MELLFIIDHRGSFAYFGTRSILRWRREGSCFLVVVSLSSHCSCWEKVSFKHGGRESLIGGFRAFPRFSILMMINRGSYLRVKTSQTSHHQVFLGDPWSAQAFDSEEPICERKSSSGADLGPEESASYSQHVIGHGLRDNHSGS